VSFKIVPAVKIISMLVDKTNLKPVEKYIKINNIIDNGNWIEKYLDTKNYYKKLIGKKIKDKYIPKPLIDKNDIYNFIKESTN